MSATPWILVTVGALIIILAVLALYFKKGVKEPDYRAYFTIGVIWIPLGFATDNVFFSILGISFAALGLLNKDKWNKNREPLDVRNPKIFLGIGILTFLLVLGMFLSVKY